MGKYHNITVEEMSLCHSEKDTWIILRQIAYNLGRIADELAEANRINRRTIGEIVSDLASYGLSQEEPDE